MAIYRISRNIEASLVDYIKAELNSASWTNIRVEKSFAQVYETEDACICIRLSDTIHNKVEVGSNLTVRQPLILIDIFAKTDGQRLDLKDFLVSILKNGCPYYEYIIVNGTVQSKTQTSRINVISITDTIVDLGINKDELAVQDRYRHLISLSISLGKVEN